MKKLNSILKKSTLYFAISAVAISAVIPAGLTVEASTAYTDIEGNIHEEAIKSIAARGLVDGYSDGGFKPSNILTRSDTVKMLGKYLVSRGYEIPLDYKSYIRFRDLSEQTNDELLRYSALLYDLGIIEGDNGNLNAADPIVREQFSIVLSRLINLILDLDVTQYVDISAELNEIEDLQLAADRFHPAIGVLSYFEVTSETEFRAKENTTRGQTASFMHRLMTNVLDNQTVIARLNDLALNILVPVEDIVFMNDTLLSGSNAMSGTAIIINDKNGNLLGSGTVDPNGNFSITLAKSIAVDDRITMELKHLEHGNKTLKLTVPALDTE